MSGTRGIIFDLFGTLVPNFRRSDPVLGEMARVVGAPPAEFAELWRGSFDDRALGIFPTLEANVALVCDSLGVVASTEQVRESVTIRSRFVVGAMTPREGTVETLRALKARGWRTGLISDCSIEVPDALSTTAIAPLLDVAVFSFIEGVKKPDPRIYLRTCERLGVLASDCLFVGDGGSDELSGARAVGMEAILFRDPDREFSVVYRSEAERWDGPAISCFAELDSLLKDPVR